MKLKRKKKSDQQKLQEATLTDNYGILAPTFDRKQEEKKINKLQRSIDRAAKSEAKSRGKADAATAYKKLKRNKNRG